MSFSAFKTTLERFIQRTPQPAAKPAPQKTSAPDVTAQAQLLGIEMLQDLSAFSFDKRLTKKVPYAFVKKHLVLPVQENDGVVTVATSDLFNLDAIEELRFRLNSPLKTVHVPRQAILAAIHEYYHQNDSTGSEIIEGVQATSDDHLQSGGEVYDLLDDTNDLPPAVRLIHYSILEAFQQGASDVHFEPQEANLLIRYRIDGVLQNRLSPAQEFQSQLLTRLKVMAKLDIAEKRLPQDGRIKLRMGGKEIDFRVSTLPVVTGERIVLRILDKGNVALGLDKIDMPSALLQTFRNEIQTPEGIILVTGPTGSGKTTTLYSALSELQDEHTNIMTIEDPVEYRLQGIAQMAVHPQINLTFASGLRHILRQDPDIIMIGEIRDRETAEIAIQAALTGHLVLSTLHTNDAPSAIVRLADMGIEPYLISSCMISVLAQRLVRKICTHCKEPYVPTQGELDQVGLTFGELPEGKLYRGKGCQACLQSGYLGRRGIYEHMPVRGDVRKQILVSPEATGLKRIALAHGMRTLRDHGKLLVREGITTIDEIWRVTRSDE